MGEYYLPCFSYDSNPYAAANPFETRRLQKPLPQPSNLRAQIAGLAAASVTEHARAFLRRIAANDPAHACGAGRGAAQHSRLPRNRASARHPRC